MKVTIEGTRTQREVIEVEIDKSDLYCQAYLELRRSRLPDVPSDWYLSEKYGKEGKWWTTWFDTGHGSGITDYHRLATEEEIAEQEFLDEFRRKCHNSVKKEEANKSV